MRPSNFLLQGGEYRRVDGRDVWVAEGGGEEAVKGWGRCRYPAPAAAGDSTHRLTCFCLKARPAVYGQRPYIRETMHSALNL